MNQRLATLYGRLPLGWRCWIGIGGTLYARNAKVSPPIVLRAAWPDELIEKVRIAEMDLPQ